MTDFIEALGRQVEAAAERDVRRRRRPVRPPALRRLALVAAVGAAAALVVVLLHGRPDEREAARPTPLAELHQQANVLLRGGPAAFKARLASLRGYPIVIMKWGSWCAPCRLEFPVFQRVSASLGDSVAFIGIDGRDAPSEAASFLRQSPVTYPSYVDADEAIARIVRAPSSYPITVFIDRDGRIVLPKLGLYRRDKRLRADIRRYLGV